MTIKSIQKVIKVGTSAGVTIPAKDFAHLGIKIGEDVEVTIKKIEKPEAHTEEVVAITQKLIKRHKQALKNLSQR
ncbi:MAG TPA: hypothetical protein PKD20_04000 [Candidatus Saccharibacteria bacterium]|nr:hypothetical protein [Candidatus Saccharibacteria bacterium]HMT56012.1 hypothetical protein [Candidatus Saccharibacteria bacterium]